VLIVGGWDPLGARHWLNDPPFNVARRRSERNHRMGPRLLPVVPRRAPLLVEDLARREVKLSIGRDTRRRQQGAAIGSPNATRWQPMATSSVAR
jgi:hypothetical protein